MGEPPAPAPTARLAFRKSAPGDLDWLLDAEAVPENAFGIIPWTREQHLESMASNAAAHWVAESTTGQGPVGFVILRGLDTPERAVELKRILVTRKGEGYGREILRAVKGAVFERLGAHRLWLDVFTDNERAWRLYASEGFVREGVLRECYLDAGRYRSLVILAMLAGEYREVVGG